MEAGGAAQDAGIFCAQAVAPLFKKVGEQRIDIIFYVGARGVARQPDLIGGGKRTAGVEQFGALPFDLTAAQRNDGVASGERVLLLRERGEPRFDILDHAHSVSFLLL